MKRHPAEAKRMALKARRLVEERFSSKRMASEYAELFKELAG